MKKLSLICTFSAGMIAGIGLMCLSTASANDAVDSVAPSVNANPAGMVAALQSANGPALCTADIDPPGGDGVVNINDLLAVIGGWGPCPTICEPGAVEPCYEGPPGTLNVGQCIAGMRICLANGQAWSECMDQVLPAPEICDGLDNNCDGIVDNGASCDDGDPCTIDTCVAGSCTHTPMNCDDGDPCTIDFCENGICVHVPIPNCP